MKMIITIPNLPDADDEADLLVRDLYASEAHEGLVTRYYEKALNAYSFPISEERRNEVLKSYEALRKVFNAMTITFKDDDG